MVTKDLRLSNDVFLPKGSRVAVLGERMQDPDIYEDPERYDAYRFIKKAEQGSEAARFSGYTSVTPDSIGYVTRSGIWCESRFRLVLTKTDSAMANKLAPVVAMCHKK